MKNTLEEALKDWFVRHEERYPENWKEILWNLYQRICNELKSDPNFDDIDFCDVSAGGIQIRLKHKAIKTQCVGEQYTLHYNLDNIEECYNKVINEWNEIVSDKRYIPAYQRMLDDFAKYGCD